VPETFDVVVVGGGSAGCALAARLSEEPERRVCLIEAGPDYGPYGSDGWPDDLLDGRQLAFSHSWETDREDRSQLLARVIGGCSSHNACVVLRGPAADYDEWGEGWRYADLEPHLDRAEEALGTRQIAGEELSPWHGAFAARPETLTHTVNTRGSVRWNAAFAYLDPARARPNLTIRSDALVDGVELEPLRVVTSRGSVLARKVVLAADAYGTPGILLRSGVGPADELARHGIPLVAELPVGEGLADHVGIGFGWEATPALQDEVTRFAADHPVFMAQVSVLLESSGSQPGLWEVLLFPGLDPGEHGYEISAAVFAMKPRSRGRARLNGPAPELPLAVDHGFLSDPRDAGVLAEGVVAAREIAASPDIRRYAAREVRPGPAVSADEHVHTAARGFFHPVATCALDAVCDRDAQVRGLDGLYVGDASLIPTIPRVSTNLSAIAVAEAVAARLRKHEG
jgi:choline dehydrogenase